VPPDLRVMGCAECTASTGGIGLLVARRVSPVSGCSDGAALPDGEAAATPAGTVQSVMRKSIRLHIRKSMG
jgi:hypothetical protein